MEALHTDTHAHPDTDTHSHRHAKQQHTCLRSSEMKYESRVYLEGTGLTAAPHVYMYGIEANGNWMGRVRS